MKLDRRCFVDAAARLLGAILYPFIIMASLLILLADWIISLILIIVYETLEH